MNKFDVVIIGSGLGGLSCGVMLSKEGLNVCLLEKNLTIGGCLQSFKRNGYTLDTGMHYVGSLSEGQIMHQYFKYFGVINSLRLRKLDENGFDHFLFSDSKSYCHAMGYERFIDTLARQFPEERAGLRSLCDVIRNVGSEISPQVLRQGRISNDGQAYMAMSAYEEICRHVGDERLRQVLAGNCGLFAGEKDATSLYEYAMITHSNIESAYTFVDGSQHLADAMADVIKSNGGTIRAGAKVEKIHLNGSEAEYVELDSGERIYAKYIISAIHPQQTFSMLENNTIYKKAFFTRINSLRNTYGIFTTYLLLKPNMLKYTNRNYYLFNTDDVWCIEKDYKGMNVPSTLLCMQPNSDSEYTKVVTLLTPMPLSHCERWTDTVIGHRGEEYRDFKEQLSEHVIDFVSQHFPQLRSCIDKVYTASPLTYRDYTATPQGSAYGLIKDYHNPMITHMPARTRISNLLISGQNLNIHGCIGTAVSAAVTCSVILGGEYLAKKIGDA